MNIVFITDPLVTTMGAVRPSILLSKELSKLDYKIKIFTPTYSQGIKTKLNKYNISLKSVGPKKSFIPDIPTFDAWIKNLFKNKIIKVDNDIVINTSSCIITNSHIYYAQGIMTNALSDMINGLPNKYKYIYFTLKPILKRLEKSIVKKFDNYSKIFISNSKYCASMYKKWGINVDKIINPPLDCDLFKPTTSQPLENYILTYFGKYGKETNYEIIKKIADKNIKIKVFGVEPKNKEILDHPNIKFLGIVSNKKLIDLYSNALYTLFAFKHEPFGYIPIESMSCGTPVLTYNTQGPSETVKDKKTGWLADSNRELIYKAKAIWKFGYNKEIRSNCRNYAERFDTKHILNKWLELIRR